MKPLFGALALVMGLALAAWMGYYVLVRPLPPGQGVNFVGLVPLAAAMIYVGIRWVSDKAG